MCVFILNIMCSSGLYYSCVKHKSVKFYLSFYVVILQQHNHKVSLFFFLNIIEKLCIKSDPLF